MKPELFDVVELLVDLPEYNLQAGIRREIVEEYAARHYEIEFTDRDGETLVLATLPADRFFVVWRAATKTWVPVAEKIAALVANLPEETRLEVFDFARSIYTRKGQPQR